MPFKPKTPCRHPGCPELTHERFCPQHAKAEDERYRRFQRDPKINRRYDKTWSKIRTRYLDAHPLCEDCLEAPQSDRVLRCHFEAKTASSPHSGARSPPRGREISSPRPPKGAGLGCRAQKARIKPPIDPRRLERPTGRSRSGSSSA